MSSVEQSFQWLQDVLTLSGHEWRGHLTRLCLVVDKLSAGIDGPNTEGQRQMIDDMRASISALRHIACHYLAVARLEDQRFMVTPEWLGLAVDVIHPTTRSYAGLLAEHGIELQVDTISPTLRVRGDRFLLTTAVGNLIDNAIKHGRRDGRIEVKASEMSGTATIQIWNDSDSLSPTQISDLFKPYSSRVARAGQDSTGVGLYLIRRIMEVHGGEVRVESQPGQGVTMLCVLPLTDQTAG